MAIDEPNPILALTGVDQKGYMFFGLKKDLEDVSFELIALNMEGERSGWG